MSRLALVLALCACDAGPPATSPARSAPAAIATRRHVTDTSTLLIQDPNGKLPTRGIAIETTGMSGYVSWLVVDYDRHTLDVTVVDQGTRKQTIALTATTISELSKLAETAWREVPHGDMPHAFDIMQALYITDHDEAFELHGEPITATGATTGRPAASALVTAVEKLAAPAFDPPRRHAHAVPRADMATPDLGLATKDLPKHGVVLKSWGLGGDATIVVDHDTGKVRQISNLMGQKHSDRTYKVNAAALEAAMTAANAAWAETPNGDMPRATDVREDLYVFDDDEAFYLSGYPIGANGTEGRPLAAAALNALEPLAR